MLLKMICVFFQKRQYNYKEKVFHALQFWNKTLNIHDYIILLCYILQALISEDKLYIFNGIHINI